MQPKLEKVPHYSTSSMFVKREIVPYMDYPWHYHPEFEIIFVEKSYGVRLMGDNISNFSDGDLMFIGSNLPHVWRNDKDFYGGREDLLVDVYVIQFKIDDLSKGFFDLPEFMHIRKLFLLGQQGVLIKGKDHKKISDLIKEVYYSSGIDRLAFFIKTLDAIANTKEYELLSSPGYSNSINSTDTERINKVMNFIMENFPDEITLEEIANLVNLNKSSFCRYFKSRTKKTFSQFLNEIRIAHACKLLVNGNIKISQICYETGYNNISHFNRQFKLITGLTAKEYSKKYLINANQESETQIES
ncbi:MAG: AraC family transcriptional regulator [Bacteroidales bacterium]|nr:AraC family transcriptional regulator [Bacteroidales bacterium]